MQKHTKVYYDYYSYDICDYFKCEVPECNNVAVDIHHVIPRSHFGSKMKDEQDNIVNLIALCRHCHNKAHDNILSKKELAEIHLKNMR